MEFISYAFKSVIALVIFALVYRLLLIQEVNFSGRRFYLIMSVILSFVLPVITLDFSKIFAPIVPVSANLILDEITIYSDGIRTIAESSAIPWKSILSRMYLSIVLLLSIRLLYQLGSIIAKIRRYRSHRIDNISLFRIPVRNMSFSFFRYVFIGETPEEKDLEKILAHEKVHALQLHTADILSLEILSIIFWFNPMIWWYRRELKNVHEYLADEGALNEGFSPRSYQITILEHLIGSASLTITNNFNYSQIKNRIAMMNKTLIKKHNNHWKIGLLIPVSALLILGFACTENPGAGDVAIADAENEMYYEPVYSQADVLPEYPGGFAAIRTYIAENLSYPEQALLKGVEGRVILSFVVDKEGKVVTGNDEYRSVDSEGKEIIKGINVIEFEHTENSNQDNTEAEVELLKKEAVRVVSNLGPFDKPGMKEGKAVAVRFTFPINYRLK